MTHRLLAAATLLGFALTACTGSNGGLLVPPASVPNVSSPQHAISDLAGRKGTALLLVALRIPKAHPTRARYVSPSTQSIAIKEGKSTLGTFNTGPGRKGCVGSGASTVCTFSMGAIPGKNERFSVAAYDSPNAGGNLLSNAALTQTIVSSRANTLHLTLNGVEAAIAIVLDNSSPTQGTPATIHLTVTATDADGNTIVGPGNYAHPILLDDSDPAVATLGAAKVISPSANVVTVGYTGAVGSTTFTASATGVANATATLTSVKPHSQYVGGVWAAVGGFGSVPYFNGSASPSVALNGGGLTSASAVAVDDAGGVIAGDANGNIERWAIDAVNTATPLQSITGAGNISALAWDPVNERIIYAATGASKFCVVNANASGAASSISTCYAAPNYPIDATVSGLAVDANTGTLYVANAAVVTGSASVNGYCPQGPGGYSCINVLVFTLASGAYSLDHTLDIESCHSGDQWNDGQVAFDPSYHNSDSSLGVMWIANHTDDDVIGLASSSRGCTLNESGEITGDGTDLAVPQGLAWDGATGIWVGDLSTTYLQHWTGVYSSPLDSASYYLGAHTGNVSPAQIAVFNVYTPTSRSRR